MQAAGHGFWLPDSFAFLCHPDDLSNARGGTGFGFRTASRTRSRFRSLNRALPRTFTDSALRTGSAELKSLRNSVVGGF